jgi:hypothetical protein
MEKQRAQRRRQAASYSVLFPPLWYKKGGEAGHFQAVLAALKSFPHQLAVPGPWC